VYLFKPSWGADALAESSAEVGLVFGSIGTVLGSIWGRPTWGVYWSWDPRLTTVAILLVAYAGYLALRKFIEDPERRATWSAVVAIISAVDVPIVYFSVKWWRSLHQVQSSPKTVDHNMVFALRWHAIGVLFLTIWFVWNRYRLARKRLETEVALPPDVSPSPSGA
jgi:heme exporter protein C